MPKTVIETSKSKAIGPYSLGMAAGDFVFLSGQIPLDSATGKLVPGGIEAQTEQVFANIKYAIPGSDERMRVSSVILPASSCGTLRSARMKTRWFFRLRSVRRRNFIARKKKRAEARKMSQNLFDPGNQFPSQRHRHHAKQRFDNRCRPERCHADHEGFLDAHQLRSEERRVGKEC